MSKSGLGDATQCSRVGCCRRQYCKHAEAGVKDYITCVLVFSFLEVEKDQIFMKKYKEIRCSFIKNKRTETTF